MSGIALLRVALGMAALTLAGCGDDEASTTTGNSTKSATIHRTHTNADWETVFSDPDSYKGDPVKLVGKVLSAERDKDVVTLQVYMAKNHDENHGLSTVVTTKRTARRFDSDDYVRITGRVKGKIEGQNLVGDALVFPVVKASSVIVVSAFAGATPAHTTYGAASSVKGRIRMTVRKIEGAPDETRVFVTVLNESTADFFFDTDSTELVAGQDAESSFPSFDIRNDYPHPARDVPAGSKTSGVIVFDPIPKGAGLRLSFMGDSDNDDVGLFGTLDWTFRWK